ncbi:sirohydrochlorin chelatase [Alicyclobacillus macrosporangiidus]|uniref:Sirohydrochlorin cobaltochelatase n=1 Tax=Alicyclobacillus macrosporangiidus TaxID=392015 RepID=A0A1I7JJM1_9BACL|nr:sirohydrochlorin chelatase [Alicyclobacillus macrosporangiidus]SFU85347.1 sirohydrochlorin cobaltochelatase [Alicyclobacillus macrosporangiidus]
MSERVLLIGHGSRDDEGNRAFLAFARRVQAAYPKRRLETCFLELAEPDVPTGVAACAEAGASRVIALPLILLAASHVKLEIPELLDHARLRHPGLSIDYGRNVGMHERVLDLLVDQYQAAARGTGSPATPSGPGASTFGATAAARAEAAQTGAESTAIVLMGRGSSDPDANGDLYKMARMLWERTGVATVEVCFSGITGPRLPEGVRRAVQLGAARVVVVPYFLFTGVLLKRMARLLEDLQAQHLGVPMRMAGPLGEHPGLVDIVIDRVEEAAAGAAHMNCGFCTYRRHAVHAHGGGV